MLGMEILAKWSGDLCVQYRARQMPSVIPHLSWNELGRSAASCFPIRNASDFSVPLGQSCL